jgi:hypothetical protein
MRLRGVVITVVVVLVLAAVAVVGDVVVRMTAEQRLTDQVAGALGTQGTTSVELTERRPLLLQLAGGRLDEVRVTADRVALDQGYVTDVDATATGVSVRAPYVAAELTVTGTLPIEVVHDRIAEAGLDVDLAAVGDALRASGNVLGVAWSVALVPRVAEGGLAVDVESADLAGVQVGVDALPAEVGDTLTGLEVPVSGLPVGLALTAARVVADGVEVTATGTDVPLREG